ncbi:SAF domain-containing protein [Nonomuraea sp. NPDC049152]|uniref:SAF domain-containing protein n=1 Tax=Nonomuraea sp. NPDC049152 TaxID=3154350 RepID=UPI0033D38AE3
MLFGGIVVLACSFASAAVTLRVGAVETGALAVQTDLQVGHTLTAADLRAVKGSMDANLVPPGMAQKVIGRQTKVPLMAGTLVTENVVGDPAFPQPGLAVVGVAVKPGQYPPDLAPGDRVSVSPIPETGVMTDANTKVKAVVAVVTKVDRPEQPQNPAVVTLLLPQIDAQSVSAPIAQGLVSLMQISPEAP